MLTLRRTCVPAQISFLVPMARRPKKVHERRDQLSFGDLTVPVRLIVERGRYNARASLSQKALIIRVPAHVNEAERTKMIRDMVLWAQELYAKKPEAFAHYRKAELARAYAFDIRDQYYLIDVDTHGLKSHRIIKVADDKLEVRLNPEDARAENGEIVGKLLAKYFAGVYLSEVTCRVHELNEAHFRRPINHVKLSDTYSRWGSCSHKGNINLATRLLLAPSEVLDAVIIHELAHLVEQNHSSRFWAQVERALPNHKEYDVWLKKHGKELLFIPIPVG
ncbi:MAG: putative metal-dependent hydrolase [Neolewinella sp.]|jgi:predicted metal-dependent hydrolase